MRSNHKLVSEPLYMAAKTTKDKHYQTLERSKNWTSKIM